MVYPSSGEEGKLRIVHVLRAPLGGLWRHVLDLAREQVARGHAVGLITDAVTGGPGADAVMRELSPSLTLGVSRTPMRRNPHPTDLSALIHVSRRIMATRPDVVHGHGSKGGVLARLAPLPPGLRPIRAYTPHGGSLNYRPGTRLHGLYMRVEAALQRRTDLILFESAFVASRYATDVGSMPRFHAVVHNGISPAEFARVHPDPDAADLLYVGELRAAKGIDTLLAAVARVAQTLGSAPTLVLVGSGPDRSALEALAARLGLGASVRFQGVMPAHDAFRRGRILVVPSRAESLPYVVLEAAGASVPLVATNVGGIPEIFGPMRSRLIPPNSVRELSDRLIETLLKPDQEKAANARELSDYVRQNFSIGRMVNGVLSGYRDVRAAKAGLPVGTTGPVVLAP